MTLEEIINEIDAATAPEAMGLGEAMRFLAQLGTEIDCRIDGLKDDMRMNEEQTDARRV